MAKRNSSVDSVNLKSYHSILSYFKRSENHKYLGVGLIGVVLTLIAITMMNILVNPWLVTLDEAAHLDYAWTVSKLNLPSFWEGFNAPIEREVPPVHWTAQHPPLFYAISAPFVRLGFIVGGSDLATFIGRMISLAMSTVALALMSYGALVLFKSKIRYQQALAVAAVAVSILPFVANAAVFYNDVLAILATVAAMVVASLLLLRGPSKKLVVLLAVVSIIGMSSRLSYASTLFVSVLSLPISYLIHLKQPISERLYQGIKYSFLISLAVALAIGWFYIRNYHLSGNFYGGHNEWAIENLDRVTKPLSTSFVQMRIWGHPISNLYGGFFEIISQSIFWIATVGVGYALYSNFKKITKSPALMILIGLFILQALFVFVQQVIHFSHGGGLQMRYFLPLFFGLSLFLSIGLLAWKKIGWALVSISLVVGAWAAVAKMIYVRTEAEVTAVFDWIPALAERMAKNDVPAPTLVVYLLLILTVIGVSITVRSLYKLRSS